MTKMLCLGLLAMLCQACTTTHWKISDPAPWGLEETLSHNQLEKMAVKACPLTGEEMLTPIFASDGCTASPDGDGYLGCCVKHDMAYWCGGTAAARRKADRELRECVAAGSNSVTAWWLYIGTRVGGHPLWPTTWRWGYGRRWRGRHWDAPQQPAQGADNAEQTIVQESTEMRDNSRFGQ
jgi:hypothetical protein